MGLPPALKHRSPAEMTGGRARQSIVARLVTSVDAITSRLDVCGLAKRSALFLLLATVPAVHGKFMLIGHRGAAAHAPENTLASFNKAKIVADFVEFDVWPTKDGQLVVIHDGTVDRTTNGKGEVSSMTLAELRTLDAGSWFNAAFAGEKIPTADETVRAIQTEAAPFMERKGGTVAQFVDLLKRVPLRPEGIVMSFDYPFIIELKRAKPDVQIGWLGSGTLTATKWASTASSRIARSSSPPIRPSPPRLSAMTSGRKIG